MRELPKRAWNRIIERAQVLQLKRSLVSSLNFNGPHQVNVYHRTVSYNDLEAVAQLLQTDEEKDRVRQIVNELAQETLRGNLAAHWWLPLDCICFAGIAELSETQEEKLNVSEAACGSHHPNESLRH